MWLTLAISLFIFLHFVNFTRKKGRTIKFSNFDIASDLSKHQRDYLKLFIRVLVLVLLVLVASGPIYETSKVTDSNFVIAIDNSNRITLEELEAIKKSVIKFVNLLPENIKVGLVSFSEKGNVENELISDKSEIINSIEKITVNDNENRNVEDAVLQSSNLLAREEERIIQTRRASQAKVGPQDFFITSEPKAMILITSQEKTESSIEKAIATANDNSLTVYAIAVKFNRNLEETFNEDLKKMSQSTLGEFFSAEREINLEQAFRRIASFTAGKTAVDLTNPLLITIFIFLILGWILEYLIFGTIP